MPHNYSEYPLYPVAVPVLDGSCVTTTAGQPRLNIPACDLQTDLIERTRTEKNLQQQFTRINLLNQITRAISERHDLNHILDAVLQQLQRNLAIDMGLVMFSDQVDDVLTVAAIRLTPHSALASFKLRQRDVVNVADSGLADCLHGQTLYAKDTTSFAGSLFTSLAGCGLRCAVVVPLLVADRPFGVLLASRRPADAFSSGECEFIRIIGDHLALAAHQARLYDQLQTAYDELKQTQQAVMQQERLRALGEMASGIAHDINNTLSPIVVYSELILQSGTSLNEDTCRQLRSIKTAGEDIAHLVSRLRDFYRKRETFDEVSLVNCNDLVQQVIDLTRPRWRDMPMAKGLVIHLRADLHPGLVTVNGNAAEIREALANLILNAVDAMPSGGTLTISTRTTTTIPARVVIEVHDTGIGMDEVTRVRCLEPFFSTKGQRGTGLGLAMVYGIIQRHRGNIEIDSKLGSGTTIRLILPAGENTAVPVGNNPTQQRSKPLRILYIDDEPLLRDLLKETLELDGHSVTLADHGHTGIDAFQRAARTQQPFDIVITDLGMPQLDGWQVARMLKTEAPRVPILLLTGWGTMIQADGSQSEYVDAIISKPPHVDELRATLHRLGTRV